MIKRNAKMENINIEWNQELFRGMKYSEIVAFKKKYRKLVVKHYKLAVKKAEVEVKLLQAREEFLNRGKAKKAAPQKFRIVIGGIAIATVCLATSVTFADSKDNYVATNNIAASTVENNTVAEAIEEQDIKVVEENYSNIETEIGDTYTYEASNDECEYVYDSVEEFIAPSVEAALEIAPITEEVTPILEESVIEDIVIFDKALEMILNRCEASENGTVFKNEYSPSFVPLMGTFILPEYEDMSGYKVAGWFERYFGSEVTTYSLKYNTSFLIKEGGVKFENTLDGFKVYIDKNFIDASVNLDLKDAEEASIRAGVSKQVRDYLLSEDCLQFLPSMDKLMSGIHRNVKSDLLKSEDFLNSIKSSIETELKDLTTWDVEVVFN